MKNKKALSPVEQIAIVIICVIILIISLVVFYRAEILDWIKNLPGYGYSDEDQEIILTPDELAKGVCTKGIIGKIGTFEGTPGFREQYIYFNENGKLVKSDLYARGNDFANDGAIWFLKKDGWFGRDWFSSDLEFAKLRKGVIEINQEFLDFQSELYQNMRFLPEYEIMKNTVARLYKASYGAGNYICKPLETPKFISVLTEGGIKEINATVLGWPEEEGIEIINLKLEELNPKIIEQRFTINPLKYFYSSKDQSRKLGFMEERLMYFFFEEKSDNIKDSEIKYINIQAQAEPAGSFSFGRIYPDNSIWIAPSDAGPYKSLATVARIIKFDDEVKFNKEIYKKSFPNSESIYQVDDYGGPLYLNGITNHPHYYESNLRIDYQEVKNWLEKNE